MTTARQAHDARVAELEAELNVQVQIWIASGAGNMVIASVLIRELAKQLAALGYSRQQVSQYFEMQAHAVREGDGRRGGSV